ncbi:ExbD/TolR family protein [Gloeobacter morelensis]|uniref:Biopolymer transporter ExbD n=1 Tax=Gloeobacter morelensis MG652769 TaxID=2781736 RepID=A0ABY3PIE2_9CYAN|nr:biopolymer transporter ExbD [Gloeobacter morelensis]UFP93446.1 biopolymer transporter ExbD [Gloeobacter morelensis MG652769]
MTVKLSDSDGDEGSAGEINVVPLIDVLFSILTFFVLASIFLTTQQGLPLDLPKVAPSDQQQVLSQQLTLTITDKGKYLLDKEPIELAKVGPTVKAELDKDPNRMVVVAGSKEAEYQYVVFVLDELRKVNATRIAMATDTK